MTLLWLAVGVALVCSAPLWGPALGMLFGTLLYLAVWLPIGGVLRLLAGPYKRP